MKVKANFMIRQIGSEFAVFPIGELSGENIVIELNETGAFLWNLLTNDVSYETIVEKFIENYDVDIDTAINDIDFFIATCTANCLLEVV